MLGVNRLTQRTRTHKSYYEVMGKRSCVESLQHMLQHCELCVRQLRTISYRSFGFDLPARGVEKR